MNYGALYKVNKLRSVWPVERSLRSLVNPERRISDQSDGKIVLEFCAEINLLKFRWLYHCSRKSTFFHKTDFINIWLHCLPVKYWPVPVRNQYEASARCIYQWTILNKQG